MAGPPVTNDTAVVKLVRHGITVGLGVLEADQARNARFDLTWVSASIGLRIVIRFLTTGL
jgi:hypothetical protein